MKTVLSTQSNPFAFDLLSKCSSDKDNVVISPFSLYNILSLIASGARGTTQAEILAVLGSGPDGMETLNRENAAALDNLNLVFNKAIKVTLANGIFFDQNGTLNPEFARLAVESYQTAIAPIDVSNQKESVDRINLWCRERTLGLIPEMLDQLHQFTALIALNAIYFYGEWLLPFEAANTIALPFHLGSGQTIKASMMTQKNSFELSCRPSYCAIKLPYVRQLHELIIYLPNEGVNVKTVLSSLNPAELDELESGFSPTRCQLLLPKVLSGNFVPLKERLIEMGIKSAFDDKVADFGGLLNAATYFSDVYQRTVFEMNEKGTEAAAVTVIEIAYGAPFRPQQEELFPFNVTRPFLFALRDRTSGVQLFTGMIHKPSEWSAQDDAAQLKARQRFV